jgi:hypothetical protein
MRVPETTIECVEAKGKTVYRLRLVRSEGGSQELLLEFTDGTAFSFSVEPTANRSAYLYEQSNGSPSTIRTYEE